MSIDMSIAVCFETKRSDPPNSDDEGVPEGRCPRTNDIRGPMPTDCAAAGTAKVITAASAARYAVVFFMVRSVPDRPGHTDRPARGDGARAKAGTGGASIGAGADGL